MYNKITFGIYEKVMSTLADLRKDTRGINHYVVEASLLAWQ
ncbi:hypothetical protein [Thermoanaerobacter thermocopriae]|nr:hypothetical protein [Thermoanaerobacter thermocopriae]